MMLLVMDPSCSLFKVMICGKKDPHDNEPSCHNNTGELLAAAADTAVKETCY